MKLLKVLLPPKCRIRSVHCGSDGTFFLTASGRVLACGSNEHNKLGLVYTIRGVKEQEVCEQSIVE